MRRILYMRACIPVSSPTVVSTVQDGGSILCTANGATCKHTSSAILYLCSAHGPKGKTEEYGPFAIL